MAVGALESPLEHLESVQKLLSGIERQPFERADEVEQVVEQRLKVSRARQFDSLSRELHGLLEFAAAVMIPTVLKTQSALLDRGVDPDE